MSLLFFNTIWITENILLAIIAVILGWLALKTNRIMLRGIFSFLWLLFIPNTSYMLSDIIHLPEQLPLVKEGDVIMLVFQYVILVIAAIVTFMLSLYPFEKIIKQTVKQKKQNNVYTTFALLFFVNFIIAFGIVIGRVQRTNSWEVFTNIGKVIRDIVHVLISQDLIFLVLFFGLLNNFIYFSLRGIMKKIIK